MIEYTRKLDKLGRITLPKDIREKLSLHLGSEVNLKLRNNEIIISKKFNECIECKTTKNLIVLDNFCICRECIKKFF